MTAVLEKILARAALNAELERALANLWSNVRTIVQLAAAAQLGRCGCGGVQPWERYSWWPKPICYACVPEGARDRRRRAALAAALSAAAARGSDPAPAPPPGPEDGPGW